jgi:hypothetical protein
VGTSRFSSGISLSTQSRVDGKFGGQSITELFSRFVIKIHEI